MAYSSEPSMPPMEALTAALAAARHGSFSAAALELGTTHAAVSRRVAMAENWVGHLLFERKARGVEATPEGQRVLARLAAALEQISDLGRDASRRRGLPRVRVAATPAFARFWLVPHLMTLEGQPADVRIELSADLRYADLAAGEVDLAIRYGRGGWRFALEEPLFDEVLTPVLHPSLPPPSGQMKAADVLQLPLLHSGDDVHWRHWAAHHGLPWRTRSCDRSLADYGLAVDAASAGLGVVLWNTGIHPLHPQMTACNEFSVPSPLRYFLVGRRELTHTPPALVARRIRDLCGRR